uniref:Uncharacterized protein n=1 Tax=Anguilla anguilla TaxID=7936 RepID=A0A0E9P6T8_ANGAN
MHDAINKTFWLKGTTFYLRIGLKSGSVLNLHVRHKGLINLIGSF